MAASGHLDKVRLRAGSAAAAQAGVPKCFTARGLSIASDAGREHDLLPSPIVNVAAIASAVATVSHPSASQRSARGSTSWSKGVVKAEKASLDYLSMMGRWSIPVALCVFILVRKALAFQGHNLNELCSCGPFGRTEASTASSWLEVDQAPKRRRPHAPLLQQHEYRTLDRRLSSSSGSSNATSASQGSSSESHVSHPHEAMFFLVAVLVVGTSVTHLLSIPIFHGMQQTVILYVIGVVLSLIMVHGGFADKGGFGRSYSMWMGIDSHLLLFTMLPPLVTGDAMAIDTNVAKRVYKQCLFLAGPGVVIAGFVTAAFLYVYIPYDWEFMLCLTAGAILCATDPVAVVGLLKELGASPTLTVQIQGESLLNDGTAIVLYTIAYDILSGESYDAGDILTILVQMALYAFIFGGCIGFLFFKWIKLANNKLDHSSSVIQISLTISCAYTSFILAEGWLKISGVLSTVAAAGVLAHKMWPEVTHRETMHTVWHMLEYLFNSIIFFLAGALTGEIMTVVDAMDYVHLIVIYCMITIIRGTLFLVSKPLLTQLHEDKAVVTRADVAVMTWGGLRGAIGLALGIQVCIGRAGGKIPQQDANRVLFYVSGVAAMTLIINAQTCPALVKWLKITQMPEVRQGMLLTVISQLRDITMQRTEEGSKVQKSLCRILEDVVSHVTEHKKRPLLHAGTKLLATVVSRSRKTFHEKPIEETAEGHRLSEDAPQRSDSNAVFGTAWIVGMSNQDVIDEFEDLRQAHQLLVPELKHGRGFAQFAELPFTDQEQDLIDVIENNESDPQLVRGINEALLQVVRASYWDMIGRGDFYGNEAEHLLGSVTQAMSTKFGDLGDFDCIEPFIEMKFGESGGQVDAAKAKAGGIHRSGSSCSATSASSQSSKTTIPENNSGIHKVVESAAFSMTIAVAILANTILTTIENEVRGENDQGIFWLVSEVIFTVIFSVECVLKLGDQRLKYFRSTWNLFDLSLVVTGLIGCTFSIMVALLPNRDSAGSAVPSSEARLIRVAQVFRIMRILRLFRLYKYWIKFRSFFASGHVSLSIAEEVLKLSVLTSFVHAHIRAQQKVVKFFGKQGTVDTPEVARAILQSKNGVYRAIKWIVAKKKKLHKKLLEEIDVFLECRFKAQGCTQFLLEAEAKGVLSSSEAESMLHPLYHSIGSFVSHVRDTFEGHVVQEWEKVESSRRHAPSEVVKQATSTDDKGQEQVEGKRGEKSWPARSLDCNSHREPMETGRTKSTRVGSPLGEKTQERLSEAKAMTKVDSMAQSTTSGSVSHRTTVGSLAQRTTVGSMAQKEELTPDNLNQGPPSSRSADGPTSLKEGAIAASGVSSPGLEFPSQEGDQSSTLSGRKSHRARKSPRPLDLKQNPPSEQDVEIGASSAEKTTPKKRFLKKVKKKGTARSDAGDATQEFVVLGKVVETSPAQSSTSEVGGAGPKSPKSRAVRSPRPLSAKQQEEVVTREELKSEADMSAG